MVPPWFQLGSNWFRLSKLSHVKHQSLVPAWFHLVSNVEANTPSVPLHGHQQPSMGATTKHLKVQKYTHSAGPLSGPTFAANSADDGALHSVCPLPSAINFHTTRQEVQRKIYVWSSSVPPHPGLQSRLDRPRFLVTIRLSRRSTRNPENQSEKPIFSHQIFRACLRKNLDFEGPVLGPLFLGPLIDA